MRDRTDLPNRRLQPYILSSLFAALTGVGAFMKIPITYVPFTMQDFFVILSGSVLGPKFGALSQLIYLTVGLIGAPVFAHGGGPGYVLQPTFGYLLSYPLASFVIGYLIWNRSERGDPGLVRIFVSNLVGVFIIFALGVTFLYLNLKYIIVKPILLSEAFWIGFIVFVPGSIIKIFLSSILAKRITRIVSIA